MCSLPSLIQALILEDDVDQKPDYELDAYLRRPDEEDILCDLKLWLPRDQSADGRIEVVAMGVDATHSLHDQVTFVSEENVEAAGLKLEAREILVRNSHSSGRRRAGGARLTITHIGTLRIEIRTRVAADGESVADELKGLRFALSKIDYGRPPLYGTTVDYRGNRTVHQGKSKVIGLIHDGESIEFELEQHWT